MYVVSSGDVLQIFSIESGGDLTGSSIISSAPVAVFTGNVFTSYGSKVTGGSGADLVMEQLPPTASWAKEYAGIRLSGPSGCESLFGFSPGAPASAWRVLAESDTTITVAAAPGAAIDIPGLAAGTTGFFLAGGRSQSLFVRGGNADFWLQATKSVLLAQLMDCEPALSWGIDLRPSGAGDVVFGLPPGFDTEIVVVRDGNTPVLLDGKEPPSGSTFSPIAAGMPIEAGRLNVQALPRCLDPGDRCDHRLSGVAGLSWRGIDVVCSCALTVPSRSPCAVPNVLGCPE